jgi:6,7-dimethyl-8-ribityllumazine synthase
MIFVAALALLGACNAVDSTAPGRQAVVRAVFDDEVTDAATAGGVTADDAGAKKGKKENFPGPCDNPQAAQAISEHAPPEVFARLCGGKPAGE